jgi:hypothetical protein
MNQQGKSDREWQVPEGPHDPGTDLLVCQR